jgi:endonuclease G
VPTQIWRVAVVLTEGTKDLSRITTSTRAIAIVTPTTNGIDSKWQTYLAGVNAIEETTGCDLLSNVPVAVQKVVYSQGTWSLTSKNEMAQEEMKNG